MKTQLGVAYMIENLFHDILFYDDPTWGNNIYDDVIHAYNIIVL